MHSPPQTMEQLLAIEAIKQLKAQYFLFMDLKDWESWREVFTEDVRIEGGPSHQNRDVFVDFVRTNLDGVQTCHQGYMPIIGLTSETTGEGTWAMTDDLTFPPGHPWAGDHLHQRGAGHYHEDYRRVDGNWRISAMRLTRLSLWGGSGDRVDLLGGGGRG